MSLLEALISMSIVSITLLAVTMMNTQALSYAKKACADTKAVIASR